MNLAQFAVNTGTKPAQFQRTLRKHGLEMTLECVRRWLNGTLQPAPKHMAIIEAATWGMVTRYHQRPEVFGEAPKQEAAE